MSFIKNTDILVEGESNLFFTDERAKAGVVDNSIASGITDKAPSQQAVFNALELKIDSSLLGASGGVAELDNSGKLKSSQLPAIAITDVSVVADNTERDALTVEEGDVAITTDSGKSWIYDGSAWQELKSDGKVVSVNGEVGAVELSTDDIDESGSPTNLWFTDQRAKDAVVLDSSSGSESDQAMSVSAAKAYSESQAAAASGAAVSSSNSYTDSAVSGLASEAYVDSAVSGLASESYADSAAAAASGAALSAAEDYTDAAVSGLASVSYVDQQDLAASGYAYSQSQSYTDSASGALATEDLSFYKLDGSRLLTEDLQMAAGQNIDVNGTSYIQMVSAGAVAGVKLNRGLYLPVQNVTAPTANIANTTQVVLANAASNAITLTLPNLTGQVGKIYHIKGYNNGTNDVVVQGFSGQPIDGASGGFTLSVENESITLVGSSSPGLGWFIL